MVVALGRIGDLVLVTPILRALRRLERRPEVHFLAGTHNHHVLTGHPGIDHLLIYPDRPLATLPLMGQLRRQHYDLWIDPKDHHSHTGRLLVRAAGPARSVGYNGDQRGVTNKSGCFTHDIPGHVQSCDRHATERALAALAAAGLPALDPQPWMVATVEADQRFAQFRLEHHLAGYAVVNISARRPERSWATDNWMALLRGPGLRDLPVVICALPCDRAAAERLAASRGRAFHYPTQTSGDLLSVLRDAMLLVTADTCLVHIASAFNTPIVALYANNPAQYPKYRPLSRHCRTVMEAGLNSPVADIPQRAVEQSLCSLREQITSDAG